MKKLNKGFTLVELIVVITILAVLATIAFITLGDYPAQSRDSKRSTDVANLAKKVSILQAQGTDIFTLVQGNTAPTPAITATDWTITAEEGKIDFTALKEDQKNFQDPNPKDKAKPDYTIIAVKGTGTGSNAGKNFSCFEIGAIGEIQTKIHFSNCTIYGIPSAQLYSGTKNVEYK